MPRLVELQDKLKKDGFIIIGNHVQSGSKDDVASMARKLKINFPVYNFSNIDVTGKGNGIPRAYLFDSKGNLVQQGHPAKMKHDIIDLVDSEPSYIIAGRKYTELAKVAASVKTAKNFTSVFKKLRKEIKADGDSKEEAEFMLERLLGFAKKQYKKAKSLESDDAFLASSIYRDIETRWKGEKAGDAAKARLKKLKKDKDFQKELKAGAVAIKIEAELGKLVTVRGRSKPALTSGPNKRIASRVAGMYKAFLKKYRGTAADERLQDALKAAGFRF